jgi:hypothetical protein
MVKYQYWTLIEKVGEDFKDRLKVGEIISSDFKKEYFEVLDKKIGKVEFMCSGKYICRTLKDISTEDKLKQIKDKIKDNKK